MPEMHPVGDPARTRTCLCGVTADLFGQAHRIEECARAMALLSQREWETLRQFVTKQYERAHEWSPDSGPDPTPEDEKVDQGELVGFSDADEFWIVDPFTDHSACYYVNPLQYYGEAFVRSPFVTLARVVLKMTEDAYESGTKRKEEAQ